MNYLDFNRQFKKFKIFSLNDIKKADPGFYRARLNELQKKGYLIKIINKYYIFSDLTVDEAMLFFIAHKIHSPSYISCEMALSYYSVIPESVFQIISVNAKKTCIFNTPIATFKYQKLKSNFMFGYQLIKSQTIFFKIADLEKAILDYLYFHRELKTNLDFDSLRFNKMLLAEKLNLQKLTNYLKIYENKQLTKRVDALKTYIYN